MRRCRGWKLGCAKACGNDRIRDRECNSEDAMNRRKFLKSTAAFGLVSMAQPSIARAASREIVVAEPVHGMGYLPLYIGMANGYFAEADVTVKILTIETGAGHTNAVLSGQAFAFIGGPEHNAFAKAKGAELRAVVHCVDRGNVYYCAAKGQEPANRDWPGYFKGKSLALSQFGGTPNSITRYLLKKWNLDAQSDVTLLEIAYSTLNVRLDTIQKEPELVRAFVRGMVKGLKFTYAHPDQAAEIAKQQFPTMPLEDLKATLDRSFRDEMWSKDGMISKEAWATGSAVVRGAGILKTDVKYEEIIDMSFVESVRSSL